MDMLSDIPWQMAEDWNQVLRPFACTWYLCPTQKEYLRQYYPKLLLDFEQTLLNIKELRNKIEEEFVCISF